MRKRIAVLAAAVALALTGCSPEQGPAGRVIDKHRTYTAATKQWAYTLTVRTPDGTSHTFRSSLSDYRNCRRGSAYPKCTQGR